ncbi:MAG: hypothetical protein ACRCXT_22075, partial [Paraclostridium sp.]
MPSYLDMNNKTVNTSYINPTQSNANLGKFQANLNKVGMGAGMVGSQLEGSPVQNAVSQAGPWGAIIGTASKIGTNIGEGIGGDVGGAVTGAFDPSRILMDKNLSLGKRIIGAGVPILGGIWSYRAKKREEAKAKARLADQSLMQDAAQRTAGMVDNTPDVQVMNSGGWIQKAINPSHKGFCTPLSKPTCTG